jgi:multiple sugar transport system substrate-binding protein
VLVALLALTTAACTGSGTPAGSQSPATPTTSPTASSTGPVTLRLGVYGDATSVAAYRALAEAFHVDHPTVTVDVEAAADRQSAQDRLATELTKGTAPDVFLVDHDELPALVAEDRVQPLDQLMEERGIVFSDNFERLGLESLASDSALQCMPNEVSPYVVFYNRALFSASMRTVPGEPVPPPEAGWDWEQFTAAAREMSRGRVKGVYLPPRLTTLMPLVASDGQDLVDEPRRPTTLTMADDGTRASLEKVLAVARDTTVSPTRAELARDDAVDLFARGRIAMMIGTRALVPQLRDSRGLSFDVLPLPRIGSAATVAEISGYCINRASTHVPEAADLVAFASQDKGAAILAASGSNVPANLAVLHSNAFEQPGQEPRSTAVWSAALRRARPMPFSVGWPKVVAQTQPFIDRLFYAPVVDLDTLLPRIDELSAALLVEPTATPTS